MKQLDAINRVLRLSSFQAVNVVQEGDQRANAALNTLRQVKRDVLTEPFRFNHNKTSLAVNSAGRVPIAGNWLGVYLPGTQYAERADTNDGKLYVWDVNTDDWHGNVINKVIVTFDVADFEHIPEAFAQWIAYEAAAQFFAEHKGDPSAYVAKRAQDRRAKALNQMPPLSIHATTGYTLIRLAHRYRAFTT